MSRVILSEFPLATHGIQAFRPDRTLTIEELKDWLQQNLPKDSDFLSDNALPQMALEYYNQGNDLYFTAEGNWYMPMVHRAEHPEYIRYLTLSGKKIQAKGTLAIAACTGKIAGHAFLSIIPPGQYTSKYALHVTPEERVANEDLEAFFAGEIIPPIKYRDAPLSPILPAAFILYGATKKAMDVAEVDMTFAQRVVNSEKYRRQEPETERQHWSAYLDDYTPQSFGLSLPEFLKCSPPETMDTYYERSDPGEGNCVTATINFARGILGEKIGIKTALANANSLVAEILDLFTIRHGERAQEHIINLREIFPALQDMPASENVRLTVAIKTKRIKSPDLFGQINDAVIVDAQELNKSLHYFMHEKKVAFSSEEIFSEVTMMKILDIIHFDYPWKHSASSPRQGRC